MSDSETSISDQESQWSSDNSTTVCFACDQTSPSVDALMIHLIAEHSFDFLAYRKKLSLDFYETIKFVNFLRTNALYVDLHNIQRMDFVDDYKYLQPVIVDDPLLYAFEDQDQVVSNTDNEEVDDLREQLDNVISQFSLYKNLVEERFMKSSVPAKEPPKESPEANLDYYFNSYSYSEIHEEMLKDKVRTDSYRDFIYDNKHLFKDKSVLDVGCGTGILSMFVVKAGARVVYAVDNSKMIESAREIAAVNGMSDKIQFMQCKMEDAQLPEKVDLIISEWMGYFLVYEGMLDCVLMARDKWLKSDGAVLPSHASMHICALEDEEWQNDKMDFWSQVYGFDMSTMRKFSRGHVIVDCANFGCAVTDTAELQVFDCNIVTVRELDFIQKFSLNVERGATIYSFCVWFDIKFAMPSSCTERYKQIVFSTSPEHTQTHWKQSILPLNAPFQVKQGEFIVGELVCVKNSENPREIDVRLQYQVTDANGETSSIVCESYSLN